MSAPGLKGQGQGQQLPQAAVHVSVVINKNIKGRVDLRGQSHVLRPACSQ